MRASWSIVVIVSVVGAAPAAGATPSSRAIQQTRQNAFSIPFRIDPPKDPSQEPAEVHLYVSKDGGATWQVHEKVPPQRGSFTFRAHADGEYWFMVRTLDRAGRLRPESPASPELKVVVDTVPPQLAINAWRGAAGEVRGRWEARDPYFQPRSMKIEYQAAGSTGPWQPVAMEAVEPRAATSVYAGELTWWPPAADQELVIRFEATDEAGNRAVTQVPLPVSSPKRTGAAPPVMERDPSSATERYGAPESPARSPSSWPPDYATDVPLSTTTTGKADALARSPRRRDTERILFPASDPRARQATTPWNEPRDWPPRDSQSYSDSADPPAAESPSAGVNMPAEVLPAPVGVRRDATINQHPDAAREGPPEADQFDSYGEPARYRQRPATDSSSPIEHDGEQVHRNAPPMDGAMFPSNQRLQMVNARRFELDYEVESVGPAGISKVELWCTRDGGNTWRALAADDDNKSPMVVAVDGEGVFGFRIIVQGTNGVSGIPPQSGDQPETWIGVDLTPPTARLVGTRQDGNPGAELVILWETSDEALAPNPITLSFSAQPDGPWTTIAAGVQNTGQFAWRFDDRVPDRIYVRLEALDQASNVQSVQTPEPVTLNRIRPQGRINAVRPLGRGG